jgi:uncharacterized membrane protein
MGLSRIIRHLSTTRRQLDRMFDGGARRAIEEAIATSERSHRGELRFAVESRLDVTALVADETPRERALDVFANLGVWDTEENSGILIYVLLADRRVEIVADRGYRTAVTAEQWRGVCEQMESAFRSRAYREGAVKGVLGCAQYAATVFPADGAGPNELPDPVVFL